MLYLNLISALDRFSAIKMGFLDLFKKTAEKQEASKGPNLSKAEVAEQIKRAWFDLYVSNLPNPVVVDTNTDKRKLPAIFKDGVPRGFSIDPETWVTYFNNDDVPQFDKKQDAKDYCRSMGHHETMHFLHVPGSKRMNARLIDASIKSLSPGTQSKKETAASIANFVVNYFGDLVGDYMTGATDFGRVNLNYLTRQRLRKTIENVGSKTKNPSALWKVLVGSYETMLNENFGLNKFGKLDYNQSAAVEQTAKIMGKNFRDTSLWPEKVKRLTPVLEELILNEQNNSSRGNRRGDGNKGNGSAGDGSDGNGISLPDDVKKQMGPGAAKNPLKSYKKMKSENNGNGGANGEDECAGKEGIDEEVLDEIFKLNRDNPGKFAGTLGAFAPVEPDEALRLMYRMRAKEYLIKVTEKKDKGRYSTPSYRVPWNVGEPILGKGGLEIVPTLQSHGVIIPGTNTVKRKVNTCELPGKLHQTADLLLIIDSSGSMDWNPMESNEEARGSFDKAVIAAEAAAQYSINHGGKVAVVNFSGENSNTGKRQVKCQEFTNNLNLLEQAIMLYYGDGTVVPIKEIDSILKKNKTRVVTCGISDFEVSNHQETADLIKKYTNPANPFYMFDIGGNNNLGQYLGAHPGVVRFEIKNMGDLKGVVIGKLRKEYGN